MLKIQVFRRPSLPISQSIPVLSDSVEMSLLKGSEKSDLSSLFPSR